MAEAYVTGWSEGVIQRLLQEVPAEIREELEFVFVGRMDEILEKVLLQPEE